jgi:hypothetical protein
MLGNISFIPNEEYFPFSKKIPRRKCLSQARRILEKIEREKKKGAKSKRGKTSSAKEKKEDESLRLVGETFA